MHQDDSDLRFFVSLVDAGSVTAAARLLGKSPSMVSRRLMRLEARLGSGLIVRSTRHFRLSDTGRIVYDRAVEIVAEIDRLEDDIAAATAVPHGSLSVGGPTELGRRQIAPFIGAFSERYPQVQVNLALAGEGLHDFADCLDIILRLGMPDTSGAIVTRLASTTRVLCAAPSYIARRSMPRHPRDLAAHDCLCLRRHKTMTTLNKWVIGHDSGTEVVTVNPKLSTTSCEIIHDWALSGQGIAYKLLCDVHQDIASGRLVRIFPDLHGDPVDLYAVMPPRQHTNANVRAFLDALRQFLRQSGDFDPPRAAMDIAGPAAGRIVEPELTL